MAYAPMRYCTGPGCHTRTRDGRCPSCKSKRDQQRGTAHQRGYTSRWAAYAAQFKRTYPLCGQRADGQLHAQHSLCVQHGIMTPTYAVDHIVPVTGPDDPTFWDENAHQGLCAACHSTKTARDDSGFGNRRVLHQGGRGGSKSATNTAQTAHADRSRDRAFKELVTADMNEVA